MLKNCERHLHYDAAIESIRDISWRITYLPSERGSIHTLENQCFYILG